MAKVKIAIPLYCECGSAFRNRNDGTMDCLNGACANNGKIFEMPTLEVHEVTPQAEPGNKKKEFRAVPNKSGEKI